jgi:ribosomal protein S1
MSELTPWETTKTFLRQGDIVEGTITQHEPYGVFVDIGHPFLGLIQIVDFVDVGIFKSSEYPPIGARIKAVVLGFKEGAKEVQLGVKPSQLNKKWNDEK